MSKNGKQNHKTRSAKLSDLLEKKNIGMNIPHTAINCNIVLMAIVRILPLIFVRDLFLKCSTKLATTMKTHA